MVHWVLNNKHQDDAQTFFRLLRSGEELHEGSALLALRKRVIDDSRSARKITVIEYTALIIKAWNLWREGREVRQLSWKAGGSNPEAYPLPE